MDFIHDRKVFYAAVLPVCAGTLGFLLTFGGWFYYDTQKMHLDHIYTAKEHAARHVSNRNMIEVLEKAILESNDEGRKLSLKLEKEKFIATVTPVDDIKAERISEEIHLRQSITQVFWVIYWFIVSIVSTAVLFCLYRLRGKRNDSVSLNSPPVTSDFFHKDRT